MHRLQVGVSLPQVEEALVKPRLIKALGKLFPLKEDFCQGEQSPLALIQTGYFSVLPAGSARDFLFALYLENLAGLLVVKLTKVWRPSPSAKIEPPQGASFFKLGNA